MLRLSTISTAHHVSCSSRVTLSRLYVPRAATCTMRRTTGTSTASTTCAMVRTPSPHLPIPRLSSHSSSYTKISDRHLTCILCCFRFFFPFIYLLLFSLLYVNQILHNLDFQVFRNLSPKISCIDIFFGLLILLLLKQSSNSRTETT